MRPTSRLFKCPYCGQRFWHNLSVSPDPDICPICANTGEAPPPEPEILPEGFTGPRIAGTAGKNVDNYMQAMEDGRRFREDVAVSNFGMTREEARALDPGVIKEGLRPGEISVAPVSNAVSRVMDAAPPNYFNSLAHDPVIRGGVGAGPLPYAGIQTLQALRSRHSFEGSVTENPALEIVARNSNITSPFHR